MLNFIGHNAIFYLVWMAEKPMVAIRGSVISPPCSNQQPMVSKQLKEPISTYLNTTHAC
ncbi:hypothetical protein VIBNIFTn2_850001 [Vibrio nigripulchritudo FTn2]|nr:hypothetical protein VIBNIAM115_350002 [Vibrio nigripulchritudo AM115]CCN44554.1 hypothetical protein VIBNIFTn2_850001 [Vibrio nigripulchritudo FTn2]